MSRYYEESDIFEYGKRGIRLILQDNSDGIHPVVFSGGKLRRFCFSGVPFFYCGNWFGQGYPALKAVASVPGEELLRLETVYGCFYASVFEGVDGVQMVDSGYPREAVYAYGRALGRLHALSAAHVPTVRKRSYADILEWIREVLEEYGGSKGARQELEKVRKALDGLPKTAENYGLVHYDFEPDNDVGHGCVGKGFAGLLILMTGFIAGMRWILHRYGTVWRMSWKEMRSGCRR